MRYCFWIILLHSKLPISIPSKNTESDNIKLYESVNFETLIIHFRLFKFFKLITVDKLCDV